MGMEAGNNPTALLANEALKDGATVVVSVVLLLLKSAVKSRTCSGVSTDCGATVVLGFCSAAGANENIRDTILLTKRSKKLVISLEMDCYESMRYRAKKQSKSERALRKVSRSLLTATNLRQHRGK